MPLSSGRICKRWFSQVCLQQRQRHLLLQVWMFPHSSPWTRVHNLAGCVRLLSGVPPATFDSLSRARSPDRFYVATIRRGTHRPTSGRLHKDFFTRPMKSRQVSPSPERPGYDTQGCGYLHCVSSPMHPSGPGKTGSARRYNRSCHNCLPRCGRDWPQTTRCQPRRDHCIARPDGYLGSCRSAAAASVK